MILAHFGPAIYERVGISGTLLDFLKVVGRLATPSFVAIFGLTLAFAYLPRMNRSPDATVRALLKRSASVGACALLVALPNTIKNIHLNVEMYEIVLQQYSVLLFYTVAIFVTALVLRMLAKDVMRVGPIAGSLLISVGSILGYDAWPERPDTIVEYARLLLVSGKYGVLVMLGFSWMMIAIGEWLRRRLLSGQPFFRDLVTFGLIVVFVGLAQGRLVGWRNLSDLANHYDAPPHLWFVAVAGGLMLIMLAMLDRFKFPGFNHLLGMIGRRPMAIYVAHAAVLPGAELLRWLFPQAPDFVPIAIPFAGFIMACWLLLRPFEDRSSSRQTSGLHAS